MKKKELEFKRNTFEWFSVLCGCWILWKSFLVVGTSCLSTKMSCHCKSIKKKNFFMNYGQCCPNLHNGVYEWHKAMLELAFCLVRYVYVSVDYVI